MLINFLQLRETSIMLFLNIILGCRMKESWKERGGNSPTGNQQDDQDWGNRYDSPQRITIYWRSPLKILSSLSPLLLSDRLPSTQAETEELAVKVQALTSENMTLKSRIHKLMESSGKLKLENAALIVRWHTWFLYLLVSCRYFFNLINDRNL